MHEAQQWLSETVQLKLRSGITIVSQGRSSAIYRLSGSIANSHAIYALRIVTDCDWIAREPDLATREGVALRLAQQCRVPAPQPVAAREPSRNCPYSLSLMTWLKGTRWDSSHVPDRHSLHQMASSLAEIHSVRVESNIKLPPYAPHHVQRSGIGVPNWAQPTKLWRKAMDIYREWSIVPRGDRRFLHRDFRLENTLWRDGSLIGVLDWITASVGDPSADVAHCRFNLALMYGGGVADEFLDCYSQYSSIEHDWRYDIYATIGALPDVCFNARDRQQHINRFLSAVLEKI